MSDYEAIANSVNVRDQPKLTATVIGFLSRGDIVQCISISGDGYWYRIRTARGLEGWCSHKFLVAAKELVKAEEFPWMPTAIREIGVKEYSGAAANPRIVEYLSSTTLGPVARSSDETPWCSAFVNWCLGKAGYEGTDSAWARSWLTWGKETKRPSRGCIAIFSRGEGGHVAFYVSGNSSGIRVLGGNQHDSVSLSRYPASRLLAFRVPG